MSGRQHTKIYRELAERALGRPLKWGKEEVHHMNGYHNDNRPENLMVCTPAYHKLLHSRMRRKRLYGHPDFTECPHCLTVYAERNKADLALHKACAIRAAADKRWQRLYARA